MHADDHSTTPSSGAAPADPGAAAEPADPTPEPADPTPEPADPMPEPAATSAGARKLALAIAEAGLEAKAAGIEIIDVSDKVAYAEYLVLMTGRSDRHAGAIADAVERKLATALSIKPLSVEGRSSASWVLLDYNEVIAHVFQQHARIYYDLEGLWIDASRVSVPAPAERAGGDGGGR